MSDELVNTASNLTRRDGLWVTRNGDDETVSYPVDGNQFCHSVEDDSFWFQHRNRVVVSVVSRFKPPGELLDIGGGNGFVAKGLQDAGIPTTVIEPGAQGALNARNRGLTVICSKVEHAGFTPASIPAVGLFDVLEHVEEDVDFLKTLRLLLTSDGFLFLTVPAYNLLWSVDDTYAGHHRRYTRRTITETLQRAGFSVCFFSYFFWCLPPAILLLRTVPSVVRVRRDITLEMTAREHRKNSTSAWLLEKCLQFELRRIHAKKHLPFGSSCIAVAQHRRLDPGIHK